MLRRGQVTGIAEIVADIPSVSTLMPPPRPAAAALQADAFRRNPPASSDEMRDAVTRAFAARMAAKGDRLTLCIAAIWIAAIVRLEINQRQMPRRDRDTA